MLAVLLHPEKVFKAAKGYLENAKGQMIYD